MARGGTDLRTDPVQDWIELGRFGRSHALKGELRFHCSPGLSSLVTKGLLAYVGKAGGEPFPIRLLSVREAVVRKSQGAQTARLFFVTLDRIHSKEDADTLRDLPLRIRRHPDIEHLLRQPDEDDLLGYAVLSGGRPFGKVVEILQTPAHPILVVEGLDDGHDAARILVPLTEPFIDAVDAGQKVLHGHDLEMFKEV